MAEANQSGSYPTVGAIIVQGRVAEARLIDAEIQMSKSTENGISIGITSVSQKLNMWVRLTPEMCRDYLNEFEIASRMVKP